MFSISSTSRIEACSSKGTDNFSEPESCQVASMRRHATPCEAACEVSVKSGGVRRSQAESGGVRRQGKYGTMLKCAILGRDGQDDKIWQDDRTALDRSSPLTFVLWSSKEAMIPWFHAWWSTRRRQQEAFQRFPENLKISSWKSQES